MEKTPLRLDLCFGQVEGQGEDSNPISLLFPDDSGLIAVFDGMGGAGSMPVELESGETRSSAYIASRHTRDLVEHFFNLKKSTGPFPLIQSDGELEAQLKNAISLGLRSMLEYLDIEKESSRLKSKLIKNLPTTMALIYYEQKNDRRATAWSIWAGDSRSYMMTQRRGLQQLSVDETTVVHDAMKNLKDDSPLSNYINADSDFSLSSNIQDINLPAVLISASDGAFQYFRTPMHFEYILLQTLAQSDSMDEWQSLLHVSFKDVAADDVSLSLVALGFNDFRQMKRNFKSRERWLYRTCIKKLDDWNVKIRKLRQAIEIAESDQSLAREEMWHRYKEEYEEYIYKVMRDS
jgi:serine/threonine protein phosphatase PrpC